MVVICPSIVVKLSSIVFEALVQVDRLAVITMHLRIIAENQKRLGPEHLGMLKSIDNKAGVLERVRKYREAENMCRQTLIIREKEASS
jgi:hypothetical protein